MEARIFLRHDPGVFIDALTIADTLTAIVSMREIREIREIRGGCMTLPRRAMNVGICLLCYRYVAPPGCECWYWSIMLPICRPAGAMNVGICLLRYRYAAPLGL